MKVNFDFYTGEDSYCDGDVEKDVIQYLKEHRRKKLSRNI